MQQFDLTKDVRFLKARQTRFPSANDEAFLYLVRAVVLIYPKHD